MNDLKALENLVSEIHRLNNYFETAPKELKLPSRYFDQHFKAMEILRDEAMQIFSHISEIERDNKVKAKARITLQTIFNI